MKKLIIVSMIVLLVLIGLMAVGGADGCQEGKPCNEPLPPKARACDNPGGGTGPVHKCEANVSEATPTPVPPVEETPTPVPPTPVPPEPTNTVEPTATKTQPSPTPTVESKVTTVPATVEITSTQTITQPLTAPFPPPTACGDDDVCDPCDLVLQAIREGMVVIIADEESVEFYEDGSVSIRHEGLAVGKLGRSATQ